MGDGVSTMATQPTTLRERSALQRQVKEGLARYELESAGSLEEDLHNLDLLNRLQKDAPAAELVFRQLRRNPNFVDMPESVTNHNLLMAIESLLERGLLPSFTEASAPTSQNPLSKTNSTT